MKRNYLFIPLKLSVFFLTLTLYAIETKSHYIEWKKVENAPYYRVEIIDEKSAVVLDNIVKTNRIDFEIDAGTYRFRVGLLDDQKRLLKWSPWNKLAIESLGKPVIRQDRTAFSLDKKNDKVTIEVDKVSSLTQAYLVKDDKVIPAIIEKQPDGKTEVSVDTQGLEKGDYQLLLKNPDHPSVTMPVKVVETQEIKQEIIAQAVITNPIKQTEEKTRSNISFWKPFIPGLVQKENNHLYASALYMTTVSSGVVMAATAYQNYKAWNALYNYSSSRVSGFYLEKYLYKTPSSDLDIYMLNVRLKSIKRSRDGIKSAKNAYFAGNAIALSFYLYQMLDGYRSDGVYSGASLVSKKSALLRSALLPGWGQLSSGRSLSGLAYMASFITLGTAAAGLNSEFAAWKSYYSATSDEFRYLLLKKSSLSQSEYLYTFFENANSSRYVRANLDRVNKAYRGALAGMVVIYFANLADVYFYYGKEKKTGLILHPMPDGAGISMLYRF